jgi:hypothetical protein
MSPIYTRFCDQNEMRMRFQICLTLDAYTRKYNRQQHSATQCPLYQMARLST